ncbi:MAG: penicillin-binding transpeptidase domain-containing protein, partial [Myxococcota bacterium]
DKKSILALYLTYIPFGRNVEGVEAASVAYFGHRPDRLSPDEIATLLAVPQNPSRRYPHPENQKRLRNARDRLAARLAGSMAPERTNAAELVAEVERTPVVHRLRPFPRHAHHAAYWLKGPRSGATIETTLDGGIQKMVSSVMTEAGERYRPLGIHNGVAVVVDHASVQVRALVGNFDFFSHRGGQIPGFDRPRSPGSALKPFLYALAIDSGRILPERLVADVPRRFGTYAPKNYDGKFEGLVRFEDALARSLNVPFVDLLAQIGVETFVGHLSSWGVHSLRKAEGHYGLSAAIGSLDITPLEMAGLYAMLARKGRFRPLTVQPGYERDRPVFAPGTAFLTQRALRLRDRPDFPSRQRWSGVSPKIHWKTGTSYGHRDAWAAGSDDRFTVVVWLGNFDNQPSRHLVGAEAAGPLLFDILEALSTGRDADDVPAPPEDLTRVKVCRFSGHRPSDACPHQGFVWALRRNVPTEPCPYHLSIDVDKDSGLAVRPGCRANVDYETRAFLRVPSSIRRWLSEQRRDLPAPPDWSPACSATQLADAPPQITSPGAHQTWWMLPGIAADKQEVPLQAESVARRVSWFINGLF